MAHWLDMKYRTLSSGSYDSGCQSMAPSRLGMIGPTSGPPDSATMSGLTIGRPVSGSKPRAQVMPGTIGSP